MEGSESFEDLYAALDASKSLAGQEVKTMRSLKGPVIPHLDDDRDLEWRAPPRLSEVRKTIQTSPGGTRRPFARFTKNSGQELHPTGFLSGQYLDILERSRLLQPNRNFEYPKKVAPPRFRPQPELFPEPTDDLCHEEHKKWLEGHYRDRDKELHPVYHALEKVEKAKQAYESHKQKKALTRDLINRETAGAGGKQPQFSEATKSSLKKARQAVAISRAFKASAGVDNLAQEEERDKAILVKASSSPALRHREPTPAGRARHVRGWAVHDLNLRHLRTSTPWLHEDEVRELMSQRTMMSQRTVS